MDTITGTYRETWLHRRSGGTPPSSFTSPNAHILHSWVFVYYIWGCLIWNLDLEFEFFGNNKFRLKKLINSTTMTTAQGKKCYFSACFNIEQKFVRVVSSPSNKAAVSRKL